MVLGSDGNWNKTASILYEIDQYLKTYTSFCYFQTSSIVNHVYLAPPVIKVTLRLLTWIQTFFRAIYYRQKLYLKLHPEFEPRPLVILIMHENIFAIWVTVILPQWYMCTHAHQYWSLLNNHNYSLQMCEQNWHTLSKGSSSATHDDNWPVISASVTECLTECVCLVWSTIHWFIAPSTGSFKVQILSWSWFAGS